MFLGYYYLNDILHHKGKVDISEFEGDIYSYLGLIDFYQLRTKSANKNFSSAISIYLNSSKHKYIFEYYQTIIRKYINLGKFKTATTYSNQYLATAKKHHNIKEQCLALDLKGTIYYYQKKYKFSERNYYKGMYLARLNDLKIEEAKSINNLLILYTSRISKSESDVSNLLRRLNLISIQIKKSIYLNHANYKLANFYFKNKQFGKSIKLYNKVYLKYLDSNVVYHKIKVLFYLAYSYLYTNNLQRALHYFIKVTENENLNDKNLANAYNNLGKIYYYRNQNQYSLISFKKAIKHSKLSKNDILLADAFHGVAVFYESINDIQKATSYFNKSLSTYRKLHNEKQSYTDKISTLVSSVKNLTEVVVS